MKTDGEIKASPLLEVRGLAKTFGGGGLFGRPRRVIAAERVSFGIDRGEAVALVGESGSGKSTMARLILRLERADGGEILLDGGDVLTLEPRHATLQYRRRVQMIFQDPFSSLNPIHNIAHHLERPLLRHGLAGASLNPIHSVAHHLESPMLRHRLTQPGDVRARVLELLRTVGLEPAEEFIGRYPHELSGGQRQRVSIARALAVGPELLVADEPTSMLDVSMRMSVLNLLAVLKREHRLAILLITHDLASARYLADRILVLYQGRVVENGPSEALVNNPAHPYTRALLASIADVDAPSLPRKPLAGRSGDAVVGGCPFAPRCSDVLDVCRKVDPEPRRVGDREVRCHLYADGAEGRGSSSDEPARVS